MKNMNLWFISLFVLIIGGGWLFGSYQKPANFTENLKPSPVVNQTISSTAEPSTVRKNLENSVKPVLAFNWFSGERKQLYRYLVNNKIQINPSVTQENAVWQTLQLSMEGTLNVRLFDQIDDKVYLGFQLSPVVIRQAEKNISQLAGLYNQFFMVEVSPQGQFLAFYFPAYLTSAEEKAAVAELIYPAQTVLPIRSPSLPPMQWESAENHGSGHYTARYQWQTNEDIHKEKIAYSKISEITSQEWGGLKLKGKVEESQSKIKLGQNHFWLDSLIQKEHLIFSSEYGKLSDLVSQFDLQRFSGAYDIHLEIWKMSNDPRLVKKHLADMIVAPEGAANVFETMRLEKLREKYSGIQIDSLLDGLLKGGNTLEQYSEQLHEYLKIYPESALILSQRLRQNLYPQEITAIVIDALAEADHLLAQKALLELIDDPREAARPQIIQAIMSAGNILHPETLLINGLWQRIESRAIEYDTTLLALGRLAGAMQQSGDIGGSQEILIRLNNYLQYPDRSEHDTVLTLKSLKNSQNAEIYPIVKPFLDVEQTDIRAAAHQALGVLNDTESRTVLLQTFSQDAESQVRLSAFDSLMRRSDNNTIEVVATVAQRLVQENNAELRRGMIQFLGTHKNIDASAITALQQQLPQETDRDMLKEIYKALYSPVIQNK